MTGMIVFGVIVILLVAIFSVMAEAQNNAQEIVTVQSHPGFAGALVHRDPKSGCAIAMTSGAPRVGLFAKGQHRVFTPSQILSVEIDEDGSSVTKSTGSKLGRAALGGLVFGPAGAVVGALTVNQRTQQHVSKLMLRLVVDDLVEPSFEVSFLDVPQPISKDSIQFSTNYRVAREWNDRLVAFMRRSDPTEEEIHAWEAGIAAEQQRLAVQRMPALQKAQEMPPPESQEELTLMKSYGISREGMKFTVGTHRYDTLLAAVSYARLLEARSK